MTAEKLRVAGSIALALTFGAVVGVPLAALFGLARVVSR